MRYNLLKLFITLVALNGLILSPIVMIFYIEWTGDHEVKLPCVSWLTLCLGALAYLHLLPFLRTRRRRKRGLCIACGYNLQGLIDPRCPECGTPFEFRD